MPIKVYNYRDLNSRNRVAGGHAALEVDTPNYKCYLSYYPGGRRHYRELKRQNNNNMVGVFRSIQKEYKDEREKRIAQALDVGPDRNPNINEIRIDYPESFASERAGYDSATTQFVSIPALGEIAGAPMIGLDPKRIVEWWTITKANQRSKFIYTSRTMNCAATVMCALWAGGATNYVEYYRILWVTPTNVYDYAEKLRIRIKSVGDDYASLINGIAQASAAGDMARQDSLNNKAKKIILKHETADRDLDECHTTNNLGFYDLMTYADWVRLSYVKKSWATGVARRKEQIADIDKYLPKYHAISWGTSIEGDNKKSKYILEMMKFVRQHMTRKADSRRGDAVLKFGHQLTRTWEEMLANEKRVQAEKRILEMERKRLEDLAQMRYAPNSTCLKLFLLKFRIISAEPNLKNMVINGGSYQSIMKLVNNAMGRLQDQEIQRLKQEIWNDPNYQPTEGEISEASLIHALRNS